MLNELDCRIIHNTLGKQSRALIKLPPLAAHPHKQDPETYRRAATLWSARSILGSPFWQLRLIPPLPILTLIPLRMQVDTQFMPSWVGEQLSTTNFASLPRQFFRLAAFVVLSLSINPLAYEEGKRHRVGQKGEVVHYFVISNLLLPTDFIQSRDDLLVHTFAALSEGCPPDVAVAVYLHAYQSHFSKESDQNGGGGGQTGSLVIGCPKNCKWTLIWCVLPVNG